MEKITAKNHSEPGVLMGSLKLGSLHNARRIDQVYIYNLKKEYDKNSIGTLYYKVVFRKWDKAISEYRGKVVFGTDLGDWNIDEDLMNDQKQGIFDRHFVPITNGVPACGYIETHLLFYLDATHVKLLDTWETMTDSGYGLVRHISPKFLNGSVAAFSSVNIQIDAAEMEADSIERVESSYSDSVVYTLINKKWSKQQLTPKGKVFRTEQQTTAEYFK